MVELYTLNGLRVRAIRTGEGNRAQVRLLDDGGRLLAEVDARQVRELARVWEPVPGQMQWALGPVEVARLKSMVGPTTLRPAS